MHPLSNPFAFSAMTDLRKILYYLFLSVNLLVFGILFYEEWMVSSNSSETWLPFSVGGMILFSFVNRNRKPDLAFLVAAVPALVVMAGVLIIGIMLSQQTNWQ
ncbi:MAG TPA: hypothetical protein PLK63_17315 [Catalimonadaceae bacterium]|nr:hypothetical protein [Catalimonadaceae bacterium]